MRSSGHGSPACASLQLRALQLHALAYNLANLLRTAATPEVIERWSLTRLRERLIKTGTRLADMAATPFSRWPTSPS